MVLRFQRFKQFLSESAPAAGIQHLDHIADHTFDGNEGIKYAQGHLKRASEGKATITKKIDGSPSFQIKKHSDGRVGVKYKGKSAEYNYSHEDIERQHGHKPYLARPLHALLRHAHKVLPHGEGAYQGDFMSTPETRTFEGGKIGHKPNTIHYSTPHNSEEGRKLSRSKVSFALFSRLHPHGGVSPILDHTGFRPHADVHIHSHVLEPEERHPHEESRRAAKAHLTAAHHEAIDHEDSHLAHSVHLGPKVVEIVDGKIVKRDRSHKEMLRAYAHHTVRSGKRGSARGYAGFVRTAHNKHIDGLKSKKTKAEKIAKRDDVLAHIKKHRTAFQKTLDVHHHLQQASNHITRGIRTNPNNLKGDIGDEGYVHYDESNKPSKIVDRSPGGFTARNFARSAEIRGRK